MAAAQAAAAPTKSGALNGLYKPSDRPRQAFGLCIYGQGGVGKTTIIGTLPGRGLIIDVPQIEGGTHVLSQHADRIDVVPVEEWDQIDPIYWFLKRGGHEYKWVAIDSITAFTELAKRKTIKERDLDADPHKVTLPEYGKIGDLVGELIYRFRTLDIHTIWTAQERRFGGDEGGGPVMIGPATTPSALAALKPSMLLVARLYVENLPGGKVERRMRIGPSSLYHAKARALPSVNVPPVIRNPHLGTLLAFLFGKDVPIDPVDESQDFLVLVS